jgi:hypothetical protein
MKHFEYEITKHSAEEFNRIVYFCNEKAECTLDQIPEIQTQKLTDLLNQRGAEGWEATQVLFGKDGIVVIWKREK